LKRPESLLLAGTMYAQGICARCSSRSELRYPERPLSFELGADIEVRFLPAVPGMDRKTVGSTEYQKFGWVDGDAAVLGRSKAVKGVNAP
jgi:hypothetical protein